MNGALNYLADFLFPKTCFGCGSNGRYLCKDCFHKNMTINMLQKCPVCGHEVRLGLIHKECRGDTYLDGLIYISIYNNFLKSLIIEGKYNGTFEVFTELGEILFDYLNAYFRILKEDSLITFVPLSNFKRNFRGFNQAQILAKTVAAKFQLPCLNILEKVSNTKSQAGKSLDERSINLKNAFDMKNDTKRKLLSYKRIYLFDDIYTTGATLKECTKILKKYGDFEVIGITFAKSREWKMDQ